MTAPTYNGQIVPWTTPWTCEDADYHLEKLHYAPGLPSVCQKDAPGTGKPIFGSAHYQRQRQAIIHGRCDVCGKLIRPGQARVLLHPGNVLKGTNEIGHVMAPSHRQCAQDAARACPWIVSEINAGRLVVTVVRKWRVSIAILDPDIVEAETGARRQAFGHAKLIVDKSLKRDAEWLMREIA
ncbi:MAG: hypothetical protein OIF48_07130 [Silicimonas sp.]|nr:hypothetical protein [Silicimonas sp.]